MRDKHWGAQMALAAVLLSAPVAWYLAFLDDYPKQELPLVNRIDATLLALVVLAAAASLLRARSQGAAAGLQVAGAFGAFILVYSHLGSARWTVATTRLHPSTPVKVAAAMLVVAGAVWLLRGPPANPFVRIAYGAIAVGAGLALLPVPGGEELRRWLIALFGSAAVVAGLVAPQRPYLRPHRLPLLVGGGAVLMAINPGAALGLSLIAVVGITVALAAAAWTVSAVSQVREFVALWLVLLTAIGVVRLERFFSTVDGIHPQAGAPAFAAAAIPPRSGRLPDVYFYVFDAHASPQQMLLAHHYDERPFIAALRRKGFQVPWERRSPYVMTPLSVGSTLNWQFVGTRLAGDRLDPALGALNRSITGDNPTVHAFRRLGYRYVFGSDFLEFRCRGFEDVCLTPHQPGFSRVVREPEARLLSMTPLYEAVNDAAHNLGLNTGPPHLEPSSVLRVPPLRNRPTLYVTHIFSPHPPFRYVGASCALRPRQSPSYNKIAPPEGMEAGYVKNAKCVDTDFLRTVDTIRARDPGAIIVAQGDHGGRLKLANELPVSAQAQAQLVESFSMFYAQRVPRRCRDYVPRSTPNIFPGILACITDTAPPRDRLLHYWQIDPAKSVAPTAIADSRLTEATLAR